MNGDLGCFIMAMPYSMTLILYVITSKLSRDFNKLTILYINLYIYSIMFMTNKILLNVNEISVLCLLHFCTNRVNYWFITSERGREKLVSLKLEGQKGFRTCDLQLYWLINPLTAKLFNLNFHPLEIVSRWRDPQLQVSENYSDLTKWRSTVFKSCWFMSYLIFNIFKLWYLMC